MDSLDFESDELKDGFGRLRAIGFTEELAEVFQAMNTYTSVLEAYHEGLILEPNMCKIIDQRNLIQYRLMSLPSAVQLGDIAISRNSVYEVCRIAGIIFSVGVIFPLPGQSSPLPSLAKQLKQELENSHFNLFQHSPDTVDVLIWILVLGGIAATGPAERIWFTQAISKYIGYAHLLQWVDLKRTLKKMLWLDTACDDAGQQLWEEVGLWILQNNSPGGNIRGAESIARRPSPCQQCRQKKVRCDKKMPCANCMKNGFTCSYMQMPQTKSYTTLQERLHHLEIQLGTVLASQSAQ
jgi:hypothetical protein